MYQNTPSGKYYVVTPQDGTARYISYVSPEGNSTFVRLEDAAGILNSLTMQVENQDRIIRNAERAITTIKN